MCEHTLLVLASLASLVTAIPTTTHGMTCGSLVASADIHTLVNDAECHMFASSGIEEVTVNVTPGCICAFFEDSMCGEPTHVIRGSSMSTVVHAKFYSCTPELDSMDTGSDIAERGDPMDIESLDLEALGIQMGDSAQIADLTAKHGEMKAGDVLTCAEAWFAGGQGSCLFFNALRSCNILPPNSASSLYQAKGAKCIFSIHDFCEPRIATPQNSMTLDLRHQDMSWKHMGIFDDKINRVICFPVSPRDPRRDVQDGEEEEGDEEEQEVEAPMDPIPEPIAHVIDPAGPHPNLIALPFPATESPSDADIPALAPIPSPHTEKGDILLCRGPDFELCSTYNVIHTCTTWDRVLSSFIQWKGAFCYWHEEQNCLKSDKKSGGRLYWVSSLNRTMVYSRLDVDVRILSVECEGEAYWPPQYDERW